MIRTMDQGSAGPGPDRVALFLVVSVILHIVILFGISQHGNLFKSTRPMTQSEPLKIDVVELPAKIASSAAIPVPEPAPIPKAAPEPEIAAPDEIPVMDDNIYTEIVKVPEETLGEEKKPEGETLIAQKDLSVKEESLPEPGIIRSEPAPKPEEPPSAGEVIESLKEVAQPVSADAAPLAKEKEEGIQKITISTPVPPLQKEKTSEEASSEEGSIIKPTPKGDLIYKNPLGPIAAVKEPKNEAGKEPGGTLRPSDKSLFEIATDSGPAGTNLVSDQKKRGQVLALNTTSAGYDLFAIVDQKLSLMSATIKDDYYNLHVKNRIQFNNEFPISAARRGEQGKVRVYFEIKRDGSVDKNNIELIRSSGYTALDEAALTAIRLGARFNALPDDFEKEVASFDVTFNYIIRQIRRAEQRR